MELEMQDVTLGIAVELQNLQIPNLGPMERSKQQRLMQVVSALLEFKSEEKIVEWLLKPNKQCRGKPPMDLVNSEYATEDLMAIIEQAKNGVYT